MKISQTQSLLTQFGIPRIIATIVLVSILVSSVSIHFWLSKENSKPLPSALAPKEQWMTVFVHGSFATALGFISVFNVIKDKVKKTNYKKMVALMRKDPFFYQMQPLQDLGLRPVEATTMLKDPEQKYAIMPVAAAYQAISELSQTAPEENHFYTYGWSGLISQYRRRKEAIDLYQALVTEYNALKEKGITPKIRLIAHSHGGNLILNTAGIHDILQKGIENPPSTERYPDSDQLQSMTALHQLLSEKQKKEPESPLTIAPFTIDEVVLLGTPIQPETLPFFLSPFFKKIYNIYSDDDIIQSMDWVSTRRYYSEKRVSLSPITTEQPTIIQLKITLNKPTPQIPSPAVHTEDEKKEGTEKTIGTIKNTITTIWSRIFGAQQSHQILDPLHKEFWFMGWKNQDKIEQAQQYIKPYPYVILIPYLQKLVQSMPDAHDFDVRLKFKPDAVHLIAYLHDTTQKRKKTFINRAFLQELQEQALAWQPHNITPSYEMELLHKYSQMLNI